MKNARLRPGPSAPAPATPRTPGPASLRPLAALELPRPRGGPARALAFGVDDADRPLQARRAQRISGPRRGIEAEQELLLPHLVQQLLDAARERGPHPFALCRPLPVVGRRDRAGVGGEADQTAVASVPLAGKLADVE